MLKSIYDIGDHVFYPEVQPKKDAQQAELDEDELERQQLQ